MNGPIRRPLAMAAALFLLLLYTTLRSGSALALPLCIGTTLASTVLAGVAAGSSKAGLPLRRRLLLTAGLLLSAALAFFSAYRITYIGTSPTLTGYSDTPARLQLTVTKEEYSTAYSASYLCRLESINESKLTIDGRITFPYGMELAVGDRIATVGSLTLLSPDNKTLARCYDYSQGIFFEAAAQEDSEFRLLSHSDRPAHTVADQCRRFVRRRLYPYLSDDTNGLVSALLVGDKSGLSDSLSSQFRNLGLSHTLAVSGLHLTILCGSLLWILKKLRLPRLWRLPILLPILLFYMILVGSPSVYRAGGMMILLLCSHYAGRKVDTLTSLTAIVALICLYSPQSVLDVGLLLSFFATLGIILVGAPLSVRLQKLPALPRYLLSALAITGGATLFTLPFSVWYFGEWAVLSPLANLLLVPLITALLYLAPLLLLLSPIPFLAHTPALLLESLSGLVRWAGGVFGSSDYLLLPLQYSFIEICALVAIFLAGFLYCIPKARMLPLAVGALFLAVAGGYCCLHALGLSETTEVDSYRMENSRYLAVRGGTRVLMVDYSYGAYSFWDNATAACKGDPLIRADTLLLTDYHYRQIARLTRYLQKGELKYLILPAPSSSSDEATQRVLEERAKLAGCTVLHYSSTNCCIDYHGIRLRFTYQSDDATTPHTVTVSTEDKRVTYPLFPYGKEAE